MLKNYKFNGYDWTELAHCFQTYRKKDSEEEVEAKLRAYLSGVMCLHNKWKQFHRKLSKAQIEKVEWTIKKCREFVKQLSHGHSTVTPLWGGLAKIKDDEFFLIWVERLLTHLWD